MVNFAFFKFENIQPQIDVQVDLPNLSFERVKKA